MKAGLRSTWIELLGNRTPLPNAANVVHRLLYKHVKYKQKVRSVHKELVEDGVVLEDVPNVDQFMKILERCQGKVYSFMCYGQTPNGHR